MFRQLEQIIDPLDVAEWRFRSELTKIAMVAAGKGRTDLSAKIDQHMTFMAIESDGPEQHAVNLEMAMARVYAKAGDYVAPGRYILKALEAIAKVKSKFMQAKWSAGIDTSGK